MLSKFDILGYKVFCALYTALTYLKTRKHTGLVNLNPDNTEIACCIPARLTVDCGDFSSFILPPNDWPIQSPFKPPVSWRSRLRYLGPGDEFSM